MAETRISRHEIKAIAKQRECEECSGCCCNHQIIENDEIPNISDDTDIDGDFNDEP